jgi:hypothetical protein
MSRKTRSAPPRVVPEDPMEHLRRATMETDRMFDQEVLWPVRAPQDAPAALPPDRKKRRPMSRRRPSAA